MSLATIPEQHRNNVSAAVQDDNNANVAAIEEMENELASPSPVYTKKNRKTLELQASDL